MTIEDIDKRFAEIRYNFNGTSNAVQAKIDELNLLKRFINEINSKESKHLMSQIRFI